MAEIRLFFMSFPGLSDVLQSALAEFEARTRIHVHVQLVSWDTGWEDMVRIALNPEGPEVSEVGSTWIPSFVSMNTLCSFPNYEIGRMGGARAFLSVAWESGALPDTLGSPVTWAIPWNTDTHLIFYRRDLLAKAGVDEATAFQSHAHLIDALQRLLDSGIAAPMIIYATLPIRDQLHILASWVWGAGGHFISADGRRTLFAEPEALAGMRAFFELGRFMSPDIHNLSRQQYYALFQEGKAAIIIRGLGFIETFRNLPTAPEVTANLEVAPVPGVPFVGGTNLVVWQHCRRTREAMELVRFLTGQRMQTRYLTPANRFPARLQALESPPFTTDPEYIAVAQSLKTGRGFRAPYMWGLVEERLLAVLSQLGLTSLPTPTSMWIRPSPNALASWRINWTTSWPGLEAPGSNCLSETVLYFPKHGEIPNEAWLFRRRKQSTSSPIPRPRSRGG